MKNNDYGKNPERMHADRAEQVSVKGQGAGAAQTATRTMIEAQVLQRAQRKMMHKRIYKKQKYNSSNPKKQLRMTEYFFCGRIYLITQSFCIYNKQR